MGKDPLELDEYGMRQMTPAELKCYSAYMKTQYKKFERVHPITWRVWWRFLICTFFHRGSTVYECKVCHHEFWKE
jgi:hypothetical protein